MKQQAVAGQEQAGQALPDRQRTEQFVRLLGKYQQRVHSFILTLVPHWADADEVLQETNTVLWRKFCDYEPGTDFVRWANQVAFYEVRKFRRRRHKDCLFFSDAFVEDVAAEAAAMSEMLQTQRDLLACCLQKLPDRDRKLIQLRYDEGSSTQRVAEQLGRSVDSVYKSLGRVRRTLLSSVHRMIVAEERV